MDAETIRETTWNLCKIYDLKNRRRTKIHLSNFITLALELRFGPIVENDYRADWQAEMSIFCSKYGYAS